MEILYLIPARGGSKGLPGKNTKDLNGKPMIAYSIEAVQNSSHSGRIVVSTEDEKIAQVSRKLGAEVVNRPKELAEDESSTADVALHCLDELGKGGFRPDVLVLLQPTSPLRISEDIDGAIKKFIDSGVKACVTVCQSTHPAEWNLLLDEGGNLSPLFGWEKFSERRQDLQNTYHPNGAVFVIGIQDLQEGKKFYVEDSTAAQVMPSERSVDVDNLVDFLFAEMLMRGRDESKDK
jgi:CMP-N-acetylneuraminic acid synthetase